MSETELLAQRESTLSPVDQALHVKRIWLLVVGFFLAQAFGWVIGLTLYVGLLFFFVRFFPLKVMEKEGVLYRKLQLPLLLWSRRLARAVDRLLMSFVHLCLFFGLAFGQEQGQEQKQVGQEQEKQEEVIYRTESVLFIDEKELRKLIKELERKEKIIRQQEELIFGGERELSLRGVNFFTYHPDLPLLFVFDRQIKHVLMHTASAKAVYEKNVLFLAPPSHEDGRVFGFAVVMQDGSAYYFAGQKVSATDKKREVTLYYRFKSPSEVSPEEVIVSFLRSQGRCPHDGEVFAFRGRNYRFERLREKVLRDENDVYCMGFVYRLVGF